VAERHRRRGIATELVAAAEAEAHRQSAARLDLSSGDWREDAHAFYQSAGFQLNARSFVKRLAWDACAGSGAPGTRARGESHGNVGACPRP
jgi:N-acetylglutamate synthase-like GNAT family acetyltransferase